MKVIGNMDVSSEIAGAFKEYTSYPINPKIGSWARINKMIMVCTEMDDGTALWIPMTPDRDTYIHTQESPSDTWNVPHNFGINEVIIQCYDSTGKVIQPSDIEVIDENTSLITFPEIISGKAVALVGYTDGQAINTTLAESAGNGTSGTPMFDEMRTGVNGAVMILLKGKDGMIYQTGRNYYHSAGLGNGSGDSEGGIKLLQLPYYKSKVKDFGYEWGICWVLFENGELWGWGYGGGYIQGNDSTATLPIPTLIASDVKRIIQTECSGYFWSNDNRRRIYEMFDGSFKIVGRCGSIGGEGTTQAKIPTDIRLPEGVSMNDIDDIFIRGNYTRGYIWLQTKDRRHFITGNNAHGQMGLGSRTNAQVGWTELPNFQGKTVESLQISDGWSSKAGYAASYALFTDEQLYMCGEGSSGQFHTGMSYEAFPMDADKANSWTKIHERVSEMYVTHAPTSVAMKKNNQWGVFGYNNEYQVDSVSSTNTFQIHNVPFISGDAKLVSRLKSYDTPYNHLTVFLEGHTMVMRATGAYGIAADGENGRVLKEWEQREFIIDGGNIKDVQINNSHGQLNTMFVLMENGVLYSVGYASYNIQSGFYGHHDRATSSIWRRLN